MIVPVAGVKVVPAAGILTAAASVPAAATFDNAGAAALSVAEMLCVAPVIVIVDVKQTGPVPPAGRIVPALEHTVNFHCRFGDIAVELTRFNVKDPAVLRFAGPALMLKADPLTVGVTPAVTTCAEIVPSA